MTAPYRSDLADLITKSLEHRLMVTAVPAAGPQFRVPVVSGSVALSEDWSPYQQVNFQCAVPDDLAQLDALDGRTGCRLITEAGYTLPDRTEDLQLLSDVMLTDRDVARPADTMDLTGYSDELRAQDRLIRVGSSALAGNGLEEIIAGLANTAMDPGDASLVVDLPTANYKASLVNGATAEAGDNFWSLMEDLVTSAEARLYVDEYREWVLTVPAMAAGTPVHHLTVGADGTIITSTATLGRTGWYNDVVLDYQWKTAAGDDRRFIGRASVTGGALRVGAVGYRTFYQRRDTPTTQARANATAKSMVRNLVTRGRGITLTAISAYWLRPGDTITVTLPTGDTEAHIIKSVTFNFPAGTMTVITRQPNNVTITTGE